MKKISILCLPFSGNSNFSWIERIWNANKSSPSLLPLQKFGEGQNSYKIIEKLKDRLMTKSVYKVFVVYFLLVWDEQVGALSFLQAPDLACSFVGFNISTLCFAFFLERTFFSASVLDFFLSFVSSSIFCLRILRKRVTECRESADIFTYQKRCLTDNLEIQPLLLS